jgi:nucleotide-binding universal stress UspA family protein
MDASMADSVAVLNGNSHPLPDGSVIDGFRIGRLLHDGVSTRIYVVQPDEGSPQSFPLLMKMPRLGTGLTSEGVLSFETERMILPTLRGPHIPRFIAAGDIERTPYLVMEAIEGKTLAEVLSGAPPPAERIAELGAKLADALHSLHRQKVAHLDLKPDNVVLRADGSVALIDFGLAHHAELPDLLAEEKRFAAGSAPYVAPEQVLGVRSDPRADLFALGVVLYETATGELPFGVPSTRAGLRDRLWLDPPPPRAYELELPPWLQEVILRCLEPQPELRYQSAAHIAFDLRHPEQVELSQRAAKTRRAGFFSQLRRWWRTRNVRVRPQRLHTALVGEAQVILVAVDSAHPEDERQPVILRATQGILTLGREFRVICVAVVAPTPPAATDIALLEHRVRVLQWAEPLDLPSHRLAVHVLEATDPARALLDFARANLVDLIVLGAPAASAVNLSWWRSVASTVTAHAHCSVYVVRVPVELA